MRLTGAQLNIAAEISDGTDVTLTRQKGDLFVDIHRLEDDLCVRIEEDGSTTTLSERQGD